MWRHSCPPAPPPRLGGQPAPLLRPQPRQHRRQPHCQCHSQRGGGTPGKCSIVLAARSCVVGAHSTFMINERFVSRRNGLQTHATQRAQRCTGTHQPRVHKGQHCPKMKAGRHPPGSPPAPGGCGSRQPLARRCPRPPPQGSAPPAGSRCHTAEVCGPQQRDGRCTQGGGACV